MAILYIFCEAKNNYKLQNDEITKFRQIDHFLWLLKGAVTPAQAGAHCY